MNIKGRNHRCKKRLLLPQYHRTKLLLETTKKIVERNKFGEIVVTLKPNKASAKSTHMRLTNVLYLPELGVNLISLIELDEHSVHVVFREEAWILNDGETQKRRLTFRN